MQQAKGKIASGPLARQTAQKSRVLARQRRFRQQVGTLAQGGLQGFFAPPAGDADMIPAAQHVRHGQALQHLRARVVRIFQQPVGKTLVLAGLLLAHVARHETGHSLQHGQRSAFPAVEHGLAHADRLKREKIVQASVQPFIAAADEGDVLFLRQLPRQGLRKGTSPRRHEQHASRRGDRPQGRGHRLPLHDHTGAAAIRAIVHMAVLVRAERARVVQGAGHEARLPGPAHETGLQRRTEKFGKKRDEVKTRHGRRVPQIRPAGKRLRPSATYRQALYSRPLSVRRRNTGRSGCVAARASQCSGRGSVCQKSVLPCQCRQPRR